MPKTIAGQRELPSDPVAAHVRGAVGRYQLRDQPADRRVSINTLKVGEYFGELVADVAKDPLVAADKLDEPRLALAVAMELLWHPLSPAWTRRQLLRMEVAYTRFEPDPLRRRDLTFLLHFAIAYGCKMGRKFGPLWPDALVALAGVLLPFVYEVNEWLAAHDVGIPSRGSRTASEMEPERTARRLAMLLAVPEQIQELPVTGLQVVRPREDSVTVLRGLSKEDQRILLGARFVCSARTPLALVSPDRSLAVAVGATLIVSSFDDVTVIRSGEEHPPVRLHPGEGVILGGPGGGPGLVEVWTCRCGNPGCHESHRITGWPEVRELVRRDTGKDLSLPGFVASVVKGSRRQIRTKSFVDGSYYADLVHGEVLPERVYKALVLSFVCPNPDCKASAPNGQPQEYRDDACPRCQCSFNRDTTRVVTHEELILVGHNPPVFEREHWYRCPNCDNLYQITAAELEAALRCRHLLTDGEAPHKPTRCRCPLWNEEQKILLWADCLAELRAHPQQSRGLLAAARVLEREHRGLCGTRCRNHHVIEPLCWCPICAARNGTGGTENERGRNPVASSLPKLPVTVWRRTGYTRTGPDWVQRWDDAIFDERSGPDNCGHGSPPAETDSEPPAPDDRKNDNESEPDNNF